MLTDIAGWRVPDAASLKDRFPSQLEGFVDSRPARFDVELRTRSDEACVRVDALSEYPAGHYSANFGKQHGRYKLHFSLGYLAPLHGIVVDVSPRHFSRQISGSYHEAGYKVAVPYRHASDLTWNRDHKTVLLKSIRENHRSPHLLDERAEAIITKLVGYTGTDRFTFAKYLTSPHRKDSYDHGLEPHTPLRKVKTLFNAPPRHTFAILRLHLHNLPLAQAIGLASKVNKEGQVMHVPMIDFASSASLGGVKNSLECLGMPGLIVASGNSYHFYGRQLLTPAEHTEFLHKLVGRSAVDAHWARLQIEQGFSLLRITSSKFRLYQPAIVQEFSPVNLRSTGGTVLQKVA